MCPAHFARSRATSREGPGVTRVVAVPGQVSGEAGRELGVNQELHATPSGVTRLPDVRAPNSSAASGPLERLVEPPRRRWVGIARLGQHPLSRRADQVVGLAVPSFDRFDGAGIEDHAAGAAGLGALAQQDLAVLRVTLTTDTQPVARHRHCTRFAGASEPARTYRTEPDRADATGQEPPGQRPEPSYSMRRPEVARAMTSCWICSVPSKMSKLCRSRSAGPGKSVSWGFVRPVRPHPSDFRYY